MTLRLLAFACNWCSSAAADLAGTTRLEMPADFTLIRVMCSGRVDPVFILRALALGADGVLVSGCHPGDCHYTSGNLEARKRIDFLRAVLERLGLRQRLELHWVSASEGQRFQRVLTDFRARVAQLGPSPLQARARALPADKREAFRGLLVGIAESLALDIPPGAALPEELVAEGFGEPALDADKCMGCGACHSVCPAENIELWDAQGLRSIAHFHSRCLRCDSCQQACPQQAIEVRSRFDLGAFLSRRRHQAVALPLARCASCGAYVAPEAQISHLMDALAAAGLPADEPQLCRACLRQAHARQMRDHLVSYRIPNS